MMLNTPVSTAHLGGMITVVMNSGLKWTFSCAAYPRLANATDTQRANMELSPLGIDWPEIDEELSIRGLLRDHAGK